MVIYYIYYIHRDTISENLKNMNSYTISLIQCSNTEKFLITNLPACHSWLQLDPSEIMTLKM